MAYERSLHQLLNSLHKYIRMSVPATWFDASDRCFRTSKGHVRSEWFDSLIYRSYLISIGSWGVVSNVIPTLDSRGVCLVGWIRHVLIFLSLPETYWKTRMFVLDTPCWSQVLFFFSYSTRLHSTLQTFHNSEFLMRDTDCARQFVFDARKMIFLSRPVFTTPLREMRSENRKWKDESDVKGNTTSLQVKAWSKQGCSSSHPKEKHI